MDASGDVRAWLGRVLALAVLGVIMYFLRFLGVLTGM